MDIEGKDDEEGGDLTHGGDSMLVTEDEKRVRPSEEGADQG
jgi:hypothetical protein